MKAIITGVRRVHRSHCGQPIFEARLPDRWVGNLSRAHDPITLPTMRKVKTEPKGTGGLCQTQYQHFVEESAPNGGYLRSSHGGELIKLPAVTERGPELKSQSRDWSS